MLARLIKKAKNQDGNMLIEASFIMSFAVVMIAVLISLGLILYEQTLVEATANDTSAKVANVYASLYRDPEYGYASNSNFYKVNLYRYVKNWFNSGLDGMSEKRGKWYSLYRIKKNKLMKDAEPTVVEVEVVKRSSGVFIHQVQVTVEKEYEIPLSAIWGGHNTTVFRAVSRSNCIDLLDYFDTIMMIEDDFIKKLDKLTERLTKFINALDFSSILE